MGRFRIKRLIMPYGVAHAHEVRDQHTGQIIGRIVLWAEKPDMIPELIEGFLIDSELLPPDWREQPEDAEEP